MFFAKGMELLKMAAKESKGCTKEGMICPLVVDAKSSFWLVWLQRVVASCGKPPSEGEQSAC